MSFFTQLSLFEIPFLDFIRENLTNPFFDLLMPFLSKMCAHGEIWIVCALVMMLFAKTRRSGFSMAFALIFGLLIGNMILKPGFARIRPFDLTGVSLIVKAPTDFSFPSGHTLASFEAAVTLLITNRKYGYTALVLAILISFSRLYLYVHYPSDVIASIILGILFAFAAVKLTDYIFRKYPHIEKTKIYIIRKNK